MELVVFTGNRGVGKTLGMSVYAEYLKRKTGCSVFSNYGLADAYDFYSFSDFKKVCKCGHSLVLLDECHNDIDSMDRSSSVRYFSHIVFYLRKLNCTLFMTTPIFKNVSSRVRAVTDILVEVSKDNKFFFYDFYDVQRDFKHLKRLRLLKSLAFSLAGEIYDTRGIVTPLIYPEKSSDFISLLDEIKQGILHLNDFREASSPRGSVD